MDFVPPSSCGAGLSHLSLFSCRPSESWGPGTRYCIVTAVRDLGPQLSLGRQKRPQRSYAIPLPARGGGRGRGHEKIIEPLTTTLTRRTGRRISSCCPDRP